MLNDLREKSRKSLVAIVSDSVYVSMYFIFVASVIGLFVSLRGRHKDQFLSGVVSQNLPALATPSERLEWEDFEQLVQRVTPGSSSLDSALASPIVERVDVYDDSIIIRLKEPWDRLKGQRYLGFYPFKAVPSENGTDITIASTALDKEDDDGVRTHNIRPVDAGSGDERGFRDVRSISSLPARPWLSIPSRGTVHLPSRSLPLALDLPHQDREASQSPGKMRSSQCQLRGNSQCQLRGNSQCQLRGNSQCQLRGAQSSPVLDWASQVCNMLDELPDKLGSSGVSSPKVALSSSLSSLSPREASRVVALAIEDQLDANLARHGSALQPTSDTLIASQMDGNSGSCGAIDIDAGMRAVNNHAVLSPSAACALRAGQGQPMTATKATSLFSGSHLVGVDRTDYGGGASANTPLQLPGDDEELGQSSSHHGLDQSMRLGYESSERERFEDEIGQLARLSSDARELTGLLHPLLTEAELMDGFDPALGPSSMAHPWHNGEAHTQDGEQPWHLLLNGEAHTQDGEHPWHNGEAHTQDDEQPWHLPLNGEAHTQGDELDLDEEGSVALDEDAVIASQVASEEVFDLVNEVLATPLEKPDVEPRQPRLMSGYSHPGLSREEIRQHLCRSLFCNGLRLGETAAHNLLVNKEVMLPPSPSLQIGGYHTWAIDHGPPESATRVAPFQGNGSDQAMGEGVGQAGAESLTSVEHGNLGSHRARSKSLKGQESPGVSAEPPIVEIGYETVYFTGWGALKGLLSELGVEVEEGALNQVPLLEPSFLGPVIARNEARTEAIAWKGSELAEWLIDALRGGASMARDPALSVSGPISCQPSTLSATSAPGGPIFRPPSVASALLPDRQSSFLGKRQVLRGDGLRTEDMVAGLRPTLVGAPLSSSNGRGTSEPLEPMKTSQMSTDLLLGGVGPTSRDPSFDPLLGITAKGKLEEWDTPFNPALVTKTSPLLEGSHETFSLSAEEWHKVFKALVAQSLDEEVSLKEIQLLLPSLLVVDGAPRRNVVSAIRLPKGHADKLGAKDAWWSAISETRSLIPSPPSPLKAAREWRCPLTAREYASLAQVIEESRGFGGENRCHGGLFAAPALLGPPLAAQEVGQAGGRAMAVTWLNGQWSTVDPSQSPQPQLAGCSSSLCSSRWTDKGLRGTVDSGGPKLLHHYFPAAQTPTLESVSRVPLAVGRYRKHVTSFVQRHPSIGIERFHPSIGIERFPSTKVWTTGANRLSDAPLPGEAEIGPRVGRKWPVYQQLLEPVTLNSWMILYEACFVLWVIQLAKDYYRQCGKEFILYIVGLFHAIGFNVDSFLESLGLADSPIRVIRKGGRRFTDIAGIGSVLSQLAEVVWYLRSSGRSGNIPTGLLLVGPPGTGKTFIVQAIAGESKVPVIVQSASSFHDPSQTDSGLQMLRDLFDKARQLAPCILFIDEVDTLAVARPHIAGDAMDKDGLVDFLHQDTMGGKGEPDANMFDTSKGAKVDPYNRGPAQVAPYQSFYQSPSPSQESLFHIDEEQVPDHDAVVFRVGRETQYDIDPSVIEVMEEHNAQRRSNQKRLAVLMQFLMELDGILSRRGVVVIGATNRPGVLDSAFIRPGRFEKVICLQLPDKQKRIEILQLYTNKLGLLNPLQSNAIEGQSLDATWQYLANRTAGFSGAHLASAINQSAIRAIIGGTAHTIETIEHGISVVARRSFEDIAHYTSVEIETRPKGKASEQWWIVYHSPTGSARSWWETLSSSQVERGTGDGQLKEISLALAPIELVDLMGSDPSLTDAGPQVGSSLARSAYYQAGKAVVHRALPLHPAASFLPLEPEPFTSSSSDLGDLVDASLQSSSARGKKPPLERQYRVVLETRLVGHYAGKASELLVLASSEVDLVNPRTPPKPSGGSAGDTMTQGRSLSRPRLPSGRVHVTAAPSQSDLGVEELIFAGMLADCMINSWYIYSRRLSLQAMSLNAISQDTLEIDDPALLGVLNYVAEDVDHEVERATKLPPPWDQPAPPAWWQAKVTEAEAHQKWVDSRWYNLHLANPHEHERNIHWVAPEDSYHAIRTNKMQDFGRGYRRAAQASGSRRSDPGNVQGVPRSRSAMGGLKGNLSKARRGAGSTKLAPGIKPAVTWNDLYLINRDYLYHSLITTCFFKAFGVLDAARELLDYLSDHLIRHGLLREYEIEHIASLFEAFKEGHEGDKAVHLGHGRAGSKPTSASGRIDLTGLEEVTNCSQDLSVAPSSQGDEGIGGSSRPDTGQPLSGQSTEGLSPKPQANEPDPPTSTPRDQVMADQAPLAPQREEPEPSEGGLINPPPPPRDQVMADQAPLAPQREEPEPSEGGLVNPPPGPAQATQEAGVMPPNSSQSRRRPRQLPFDELPDPVQLAQEKWSKRWGRKISRFIDFDFVKPCYVRLPKRKR